MKNNKNLCRIVIVVYFTCIVMLRCVLYFCIVLYCSVLPLYDFSIHPTYVHMDTYVYYVISTQLVYLSYTGEEPFNQIEKDL